MPFRVSLVTITTARIVLLSPSAFTSTAGGRNSGVGVTVLVTESLSWCTNVRGNPLSGNSDPLAADVLNAMPWKLEPPKRSVNAHWVPACLKFNSEPKLRAHEWRRTFHVKTEVLLGRLSGHAQVSFYGQVNQIRSAEVE